MERFSSGRWGEGGRSVSDPYPAPVELTARSTHPLAPIYPPQPLQFRDTIEKSVLSFYLESVLPSGRTGELTCAVNSASALRDKIFDFAM